MPLDKVMLFSCLKAIPSEVIVVGAKSEFPAFACINSHPDLYNPNAFSKLLKSKSLLRIIDTKAAVLRQKLVSYQAC